MDIDYFASFIFKLFYCLYKWFILLFLYIYIGYCEFFFLTCIFLVVVFSFLLREVCLTFLVRAGLVILYSFSFYLSVKYLSFLQMWMIILPGRVFLTIVLFVFFSSFLVTLYTYFEFRRSLTINELVKIWLSFSGLLWL